MIVKHASEMYEIPCGSPLQRRLSTDLTLEKAISIGLKSGAYGGRNTSLHPDMHCYYAGKVYCAVLALTSLVFDKLSDSFGMMNVAVIEDEYASRSRIRRCEWYLHGYQ